MTLVTFFFTYVEIHLFSLETPVKLDLYIHSALCQVYVSVIFDRLLCTGHVLGVLKVKTVVMVLKPVFLIVRVVP